MAFAVSFIAMAALAAVAIIEFLNQATEAMAMFEIEIALAEAERLEENFAIPFAVANVGGSGARDVSVRFEVTPREGGDPVDEVTITIDILPARGVEEGVLLVSHDPAMHCITGRIVAYLLP